MTAVVVKVVELKEREVLVLGLPPSSSRRSTSGTCTVAL